jgi:hypothetical protein
MLVESLPENGYRRLKLAADRAFASVIWSLSRLHTAKVLKLPEGMLLQDLENVRFHGIPWMQGMFKGLLT